MARIDRDPSDRARNARTEQLPLSFLFVAEKNVPVVDLAVDIELPDAALYGAKRNGRNQVWPRFPSTRRAEIAGVAERISRAS